MVIDSLMRLERLNFIERDKEGSWHRKIKEFNTPNDITSMVIRQFHEELLDRSKDAVDQVPVGQRLFFSRLMQFDASKMEEAKSEHLNA